MIISIPSVLLTIGITVGMFMNVPIFEEFGIPIFIGLWPVLAFAICIAFIFIFPRSKEWKIAAVINGSPLAIILLIGLLFWLTGYHH